MMTRDEQRQLLQTARVIAMVGHSDKPNRISYQIAQKLRGWGYTVHPVNPLVRTIDGHVSYPALADVPGSIDIVSVFRAAEHLPAVVQDAIARDAGAVWAQLGVTHPEAARWAEAAQLPIVMDRCIKVAYQELL
ncbi:MAG: CoA-binding protein [Anaerolineales bacterium]